MKKTIILKKDSKIILTEDMKQFLNDMYLFAKEPYTPTDLEEEMGMLHWFMNKHDRAVYDSKIYNNSKGTMIGYQCPICLNKGETVRVSESDTLIYEECNCMTLRHAVELRKESGLGKLVEKCSFQSFRTAEDWQKKLRRLAKDFIRQGEKWFFIGGMPGTGKTHICTAITTSYLNRGIRGKYMVWDEEVVNLNAIVNDHAEYKSVIDELKTVPVLYIDDFLKPIKGNEPTDGELKRAKEIINARYNANRLTIISSERTLKEIVDIDEAIGSRIAEMAKGFVSVIVGKGKNFRLTGGEK